MRRNVIGFLVALYALNGGVLAPPRVIAADSRQEVVSALDALLRAAATCDAAAYARVTTPDVTLTRWDGVFMTASDRLKEMRESCKPGPVAQTSDTTVRTYGDVAIVVNRVTSPNADKPRRDTRVWVKSGGGWREAAYQASTVSDENAKASTPAIAVFPIDASVGPNPKQDAERAVRDANDAAAAVDTGALARFFADDYLRVGPRGELVDKAGAMRVVSAFKKGPPPTLNDVNVRAFGAAAIVTYLQINPANAQRLTRVLVRRDGRWQAVATHATDVPKKKTTTDR